MEAKKHSQISFGFHCSNSMPAGGPGIWKDLRCGHHGMRLTGPQHQGTGKGPGGGRPRGEQCAQMLLSLWDGSETAF